jgi:pseudooxynicotine oxidase
MTKFDVVIVGGGFAGVTAARELTMRGRPAVLVEARERLGGRTYTASHDGHEMELGGTWVHPIQPNVWAEITRYGIELEEFPVPGGKQFVVSEGKIVELDDDGMGQFLEGLAQYCAPGATLFPAPYSGQWGPDPQRYDERSMREHLGTLKLSPAIQDAVEAMCCLTAFGPLDRSAATEAMRLFALSWCSSLNMIASLSAIKLRKGTRTLVEAIASQAKLADIRLKSPVRRVAQTGDGVRVELHDGKVVEAQTALITLPMNLLNSVEFEPKLSQIKQTAASERHAGHGTKCFVQVKGDIGNVSIFAPESEAINWAVTYDHGPDGSWMIVFGTDPKRLSIDDVSGMQVALRRLLPGVEVVSIFGWDWAADPYALGTWCIFKPGQLTRLMPELRRSENRLFFASGDSAVAWRSSIDGAIESGYRSAREIDHFLTG